MGVNTIPRLLEWLDEGINSNGERYLDPSADVTVGGQTFRSCFVIKENAPCS
jgi:hypothetical protein